MKKNKKNFQKNFRIFPSKKLKIFWSFRKIFVFLYYKNTTLFRKSNFIGIKIMLKKTKNSEEKFLTKIFESYEDFQNYLEYHPNEKINGCSELFLKNYLLSFELYQKFNETNYYCWNCMGCEDCINCQSCHNCFNCQDCDDCIGCHYCFFDVRCFYCKRANFCTDCEDCDDCTECIKCETLRKSKNCTNVKYGNEISNIKLKNKMVDFYHYILTGEE